MPYHADSLFLAPPWRPLPREHRRVWSARVELHRRQGAITCLHAEIGRTLLRLMGQDGRLEPSHDTLARLAGCCPRTVRTALRRLRWLGLLDWTRRLVRIGRVVRQTSSAFYLRLNGSMARVAVATNRAPREVRPPPQIPADAAEARAALAAAATRMEARLRQTLGIRSGQTQEADHGRRGRPKDEKRQEYGPGHMGARGPSC